MTKTKTSNSCNEDSGAGEIVKKLKVATDAFNAQYELKCATKAMREANVLPVRPSNGELSQLDSSIKRNAALTKKLRSLTVDNCESVLKDITGINQSRFLTEATTALLEALVRPSRVTPVLRVAEALHARYHDFQAELSDHVSRALSSSLSDTADDSDLARRRALLRFAVDAEVTALAGTLLALKGAVRQLASTDFSRADKACINALTQLTTFVRAARDDVLDKPKALAALDLPEGAPALDELASDATPAGADVAAEARRYLAARSALESAMLERYVVPAQDAAPLTEAVAGAWRRVAAALVQRNGVLCELEARCANVLVTRGALPPSAQAKLTVQRQQCEELRSAAEAFAGEWGVPLPELRDPRVERVPGSGGITVVPLGSSAAAAAAAPGALWDDAATAAFYESLPDLPALVPSLALGRGTEDGGGGGAAAAGGGGAASEEGGGGGGGSDAGSAALGDSGPLDTEKARHAGAAPEAAASDGGTPRSAAAEGHPVAAAEGRPDAAADADAAGDAGAAVASGDMRVFLADLARCDSADRVDELAITFCCMQNRRRRKALTATLSSVAALPMHLLPFHARLAAVLARQYPDLGAAVAAAVGGHMRGVIKNTEARSLDARVRAARYLSELAKFRIVDADVFFLCLKACLDDFSGVNIDTAAELVIGAGAFMARRPDTAARMEAMLAVMVRQRRSRNLDSTRAALVDSAALACKPAAVEPLRRRERTLLQRYMRHLVFDCLARCGAEGGKAVGADGDVVEVEAVVQRMRRLPWDACELYVVKCFVKAAVRGSFVAVPRLASAAAALGRFRPSMPVALVDTLLEDLLPSAVSHAPPSPAQARIARAALFAHLYNYSVIRAQHLFATLYALVAAGSPAGGQDTNAASPSGTAADAVVPLRLALVILQASGHYFAAGPARAKLARFLLFLQRAALAAEDLPVDFASDLAATLDRLDAHGHRFTTVKDADAAIAECLAREEPSGRGLETAVSGGAVSAADASSTHGSAEGDGGASDALGTPRGAAAAASPRGEADTGAAVSDKENGGEAGNAGGGEAVAWPEAPWPEAETDELFERELASLLPAGTPGPTADAVRPAGGTGSGAQWAQPERDAGGAVLFRVRMKRTGGGRGGDEKTRRVAMPSDSAIAASLAAARAAEAAERGEMKRLVLASEKTRRAEEAGAERMAGSAAAPRGARRYLSGRGQAAGARQPPATTTVRLGQASYAGDESGGV